MPTLLRVGPYCFFCYASDRDQPTHVHIERNSSEAKFWLTPVRLQFNKGFSSNEINRLQTLTEDNQQQLLEAWHDFFNG
jgi:hypothetical protein